VKLISYCTKNLYDPVLRIFVMSVLTRRSTSKITTRNYPVKEELCLLGYNVM
jgi:hypothetical protein